MGANDGGLTLLSSASGTSARSGMDVTDIAAAALPCVVSITNISVQEVRNYFYRFGPNGSGGTQLEETTSCGSGVIIASDDEYLYIVTNQHVVADATTLSVSFVDNSVYQAQLCGTDEELDLAVLKVALSDLSGGTLCLRFQSLPSAIPTSWRWASRWWPSAMHWAMVSRSPPASSAPWTAV